jgi:hypothetical protein
MEVEVEVYFENDGHAFTFATFYAATVGDLKYGLRIFDS